MQKEVTTSVKTEGSEVDYITEIYRDMAENGKKLRVGGDGK